MNRSDVVTDVCQDCTNCEECQFTEEMREYCMSHDNTFYEKEMGAEE